VSEFVESVRERLRMLANPPRYGPLGLYDPQRNVDVWLRGVGPPRNVTYNNVVAALRPFTIGVMLGGDESPIPETLPVSLCMRERESNRQLGSIELRLTRTIPLPEHRFCLFEAGACRNRCVTASNLLLYYFRQWRRIRSNQRKNPYNFQMTSGGLRASYVFYICPRPVVLVTVVHGNAGNMFPMDLIGPTDSPWYSMALRKTSPAVRLMVESRRMALSSAPFTYKDIAYDLGKHHKLASIDWAELPFPTESSPLFRLPVPSAALKIREVEVREVHDVGSHMLFITSIVRETVPQAVSNGAGGPQLFHAFSSYRQYLAMNQV
jgi:flavin reductase (DIM6/NTAB) family NADH-FMN oxidoreductase RutF